MKYVKYGVAVCVLLIAVFAAALSPKPYTETAFLLDTFVSVTVYQGEKEAAEAVVSCVQETEKMFSAYRTDSEISRINRAKKGESVPVSQECLRLLVKAKSLSYQTKGSFDITVKPVMDLWSFSETPKVPTEEELQEALSKVNVTALELDEKNYTVTKQEEGIQIDLGGIAKGYAADRSVEVLKEYGVTSAVLDFGGNVVTVGEKPLSLWEKIRYGKKTVPFTVGIQDPAEQRGTVAKQVTATFSPFAVVTSGGYERNFTQNGKTYHHIVDPKTGKQPQNGVLSVTVISEDATAADALSTALFVQGPDGIHSADGLCEQVIFIMEGGEILTFPKE